MRRWMAGVLIAMMTMTSTAPIARAQSAPLIGGGLTALPKVNMGANLAQNPGFETLGPTGWTAGSGWSQDQLTKRSGTFSYRRDTGAATSSQNIQLKAGTYTVSGWVKTQSLGGNNTGVRLTFDQRPGGVFSWTPSDLITGTNDWTQITLGPIVLAADQAVAIMLENYNNPSGTAWFDDIVVQQMQAAAADVFMLYPNFRGMLFDDQPQTLQFDVNVTPPGGDFARYSIQATIKDEASGQVIAQQSTAAAAHVVATVDGAAMQAGRGYLATVSLVDLSSNSSVYDYPAYRVSKVPAAARSTMNVSVDAKNRVLLKGVPRFILGVYDAGLGYSSDPTFWENTLWSATGDRRMGGMNINMYLNYWYGQAPVDAMTALMANLQQHVSLDQVDAVVISHRHFDHFLDLYPFFLARWWQQQIPPIPLFAPPGLFEHLQVLRDRRLGGAESASEFARAAGLAPRQCMNHRPPGAVGQGSKCEVQSGGIFHSQMTICRSRCEGKTNICTLCFGPASVLEATRRRCPYDRFVTSADFTAISVMAPPSACRGGRASMPRPPPAWVVRLRTR